MSKRRIVVTSALPYANGAIHIGHLVEYLQTDFWVRFQKMRGHDCVYICADDTHGTPIMVRARKEGITPEELIARSHEMHSKDFADFGVAFDNYYTTNSPENKEFCLSIYKKMVEANALSSKMMPQMYCEHDSMFLPDRFIKGICPKCGAEDQYGDSCDKCGTTYEPTDLIKPKCAVCGATPVIRDSEHLYFELEPQRDFLAKWLPEHTSSDVANKLMEWFGEPLRGWDISRDAPYFGFEIPDHPGKFFYVWLDAPVGYMASLKNWCDKNGHSFEEYWGDDSEIYHFIGKDIVRFHCLFWPTMLKVGGFRGPSKVFVHGFLTVNGEKMSKSLGNFYTLRDLLKMGWTGREIRYVLINGHYRQILNFTFDALAAARTALARIDAFTERLAEVAKNASAAEALPEWAVNAKNAFDTAIADDLNTPNALAAVFGLVREGNSAIDAGNLSDEAAQAVIELLKKFDTVLSVISFGKKAEEGVPEEVQTLLDERAAARKSKNWAESDRVRDQLKEMGWEVKDTPDGQKVRKL